MNDQKHFSADDARNLVLRAQQESQQLLDMKAQNAVKGLLDQIEKEAINGKSKLCTQYDSVVTNDCFTQGWNGYSPSVTKVGLAVKKELESLGFIVNFYPDYRRIDIEWPLPASVK
jgi:hypothetical protein